MLAYLRGFKVSSDDGEELSVVASGEQVNDWVEHVAVVEYLGRLDAQIIDGKHLLVAESLELLVVFLCYGADLLGIDESNIAPTIAIVVVDVGHKVTYGIGESGLSVAAVAAEQHAKARVLSCEPSHGSYKMLTCVIIIDIRTMSQLHLSHVRPGESIDSLLSLPWQPKTLRCSLSVQNFLLERLCA